MVLTPARAGLARAGATRAGYPIPRGTHVPLYALANVARAGATRCGYHSPRTFITIGQPAAWVQDDWVQTTPEWIQPIASVVPQGSGHGILLDSLTVTDTINEEANTATCDVIGVTPTVGQEVIITVGSTNGAREFAGWILRVDQTYHQRPAVVLWRLALIDYTWGLNRRKVTGHFTGSASTIFTTLLATYAPGYTARVEAGLPTVPGGITFTARDLTDCLTQLGKRVAADWFCDYDKVVHVWQDTPPGTPPSILNAVNPLLRTIAVRRDLSQVVTRVDVEGLGSTVLAPIVAGETILPVTTAEMFEASGTVTCGPQILRYTGRTLGGGGSLVGPGAAPSAAPGIALASGPGIESGLHAYAIVFVTATGKSIASPIASITVGLVAPPPTAPTAGTPTPGTGPDAGVHEYAVSFVTASGETLPGPRVAAATTVTAPPATAPTIGAAIPGTGPDAGAHDYAVGFVTAIGETTPGPISAQVFTNVEPPPATAPTAGTATALATGPDPGAHEYAVAFTTLAGTTTPGPRLSVITAVTPAPTSAPTAGAPTIGSGPSPGTHLYGVTFVTAIGETTPGPSVSVATTLTPAPVSAPTPGSPTGGTGPDVGPHDYAVTLVTSIGETTAGPLSSPVTTSILSHAAAPTLVQGVSNEPGGVLIGVYGPWAVCFRVAGGGETEIVNVSNQITCNSPGQQVRFTDIPTGPTGTVSRVLYRLIGGQYKTITVIADNVTTGYVDNTPDGSAGADAPTQVSGGTAYLRTVALTGLPTGDATVTARRLYRRSGTGLRLVATIAGNVATTYTDTTPNSGLTTAPPAVSTAYLQRMPLTLPAAPGGAGITHLRIYGSAAGGVSVHLIATVTAGTSAYTVTTTDAALGVIAPIVNTAYLQRQPLANIPTGPGVVTARQLYRTPAGSGQLKLLATIPGNSATTYTDTTPDSGLGANAPTSNTANSQVVPISAIPIGDAHVTGRTLYRRSGGVGLRLVTTIPNNTATTYSDTTPNAGLGAAPPATSTAFVRRIPLSALPIATSALVTARKLYGSAAGSTALQLIATLNLTDTTYLVTTTDAALGAAAPVTNTATANQVAITGIPIGVAAVTAREVYRTAADQTQLKLLATIPNNTATTHADSAADATLGADVPVVDLSGLPQPEGAVLAGSPSIIMAGTAGMPAAGWAVIGNGSQVVRYTGVTASAVTGIPPSGVGAITASIGYNSTITAAPQLTGIPTSGDGAILYNVAKGDDVNLRVTEDDLDAQAALSALLDPGHVLAGAAGIKEDALQDRRLSAPEARARGRAHLTLRRQVAVTVRYVSTDLNTRAGRTVSINLGPPTNIVGDFLIQQVQVTAFQPSLPTRTDPRLNPTRTVEASSDRLTFEDLVRLVTR